MITELASLTNASVSTADRVAESSITTRPSAVACRAAIGSGSITTMFLRSTPFSISALTAVRPLVP